MWNELFINVSGYLAVAVFIVLLVIIFFVPENPRFWVGIITVVIHLIVQAILVIFFWIRDGFVDHLIYSLSVLVPFVVLAMVCVITIGQWYILELEKVRAGNKKTREEIKMESDWELGSDPFGEKGSKLNS